MSPQTLPRHVRDVSSFADNAAYTQTIHISQYLPLADRLDHRAGHGWTVETSEPGGIAKFRNVCELFAVEGLTARELTALDPQRAVAATHKEGGMIGPDLTRR